MSDDQPNPAMAAPGGRFSPNVDLALDTGASIGDVRAVFS
jgi:hypothetical protein